MHTRRLKDPPLPLPWVNGCDSSRRMSNAFTNTMPVSPHRAWYTDNLNICSPLIIPFTTSLYWIIHLHTSDWDQQQKGLACGCTAFSQGWGLITSVSWVGTKHEFDVEWGLLSGGKLKRKGKGNAWGLRSTAEHTSWILFYNYLTTLFYTFYISCLNTALELCILTLNYTSSLSIFK